MSFQSRSRSLILLLALAGVMFSTGAAFASPFLYVVPARELAIRYAMDMAKLRSSFIVSYQRLGAELGMTEGNVKVAVFRLRRRYRQRLTEEIAHTVASPDEVESELRHLFRVLARR